MNKRMIVGGECTDEFYVPPKEQAIKANLSGKQTLT